MHFVLVISYYLITMTNNDTLDEKEARIDASQVVVVNLADVSKTLESWLSTFNL